VAQVPPLPGPHLIPAAGAETPAAFLFRSLLASEQQDRKIWKIENKNLPVFKFFSKTLYIEVTEFTPVKKVPH